MRMGWVWRNEPDDNNSNLSMVGNFGGASEARLLLAGPVPESLNLVVVIGDNVNFGTPETSDYELKLSWEGIIVADTVQKLRQQSASMNVSAVKVMGNRRNFEAFEDDGEE